MISYGKQSIDDADIAEVIKVLKSDYLTQGPKIEEFEEAIADYCGAKYCVVVSNGTAALHLAVAALNISEGAEGITTPITFVASSNSMIYSGIVPVFADIDSKTYNIDYNEIEKKITDRTKLIIPVHFAGQPCNMNEIKKIAVKNNLKIIEDASHAIGSNYPDGSKVGNCKYSDITTFSFHPVKTITTGEGGAITTNNKDLYENLCLLRSHGITKEPEKMKAHLGLWYYEMQTLGFNYRMTDIQAALGISQLKKLNEFKIKRRRIVARYNEAFKNIDFITTPFEESSVDSCFHLYVIKIDFTKIALSREKVMEYLKKLGIGTQVHYIPVHLQPYYSEVYDYKVGDFPIAEEYYAQTLSLPLFPSLTDDEQSYVIEQIKKIVKEK